MMQCGGADEMRVLHQELSDVAALVADRHAAVRARLQKELRVADPAAGDNDRLLRAES